MLHIGRTGTRFLLSRKCHQQVLKVSRLCTSQSSTIEENEKTFQEIVDHRRSEARRSVIVQVNSDKSFTELYKYCSQFGEIIGAHHYKVPHEEYHYILIEYENEREANNAIDSSCYNENLSGVPVRSPFLWFKATGKKQKLQQDIVVNKPQQKQEDKCGSKYLKTIDGTHEINDSELKKLLLCSESLEDQIQILYKSTSLNDLGVRLRFLAARQIETSISGMFPRANAQPFGSSVNGFGKMRSDLDLVLRFDEEKRENPTDSRLVFHTKENITNNRSQTQRQMEIIGDLLHLFLPGVCSVRRILQARVPIIKFHHEHLDLEVDLSMNNLSGVYMSELFHMFGQIDSRVRPLTFCLRRWAQSVGLTNLTPGRWISNFSLTCLVIFFLQQLKQPILPSINFLSKSATSDDIRITEDGINCTFLRNYKQLKFQPKNETPCNELLLQFFEFYSQFEFNNRAISLNEGRSIVKPDHSAMYIVNPLEQVLNVSKNVSLEECERFRIEVRNAAWILESEIENTDLTTTIMENIKDKDDENKSALLPLWGLLNLFKSPEKSIIYPHMFFKPRMVEVTDLFNEKDDNQKQKTEYKNPQIRNQVEGIKTKTKSQLKQMKMKALSQSSDAKVRR